MKRIAFVALPLLACTTTGGTVDPAPQPPLQQANTGSCPDYNQYKNAYFGDLHDHTWYSLDAYGFGTRRTPYDALAFAMGATANKYLGGTEQLHKPLDFAIVSDHSEFLGVTDECLVDPSEPYYNGPYCTWLQGQAANFNTIPAAWAATCAFNDTTCIANRTADVCKSHPTECANEEADVWSLEQANANGFDSYGHMNGQCTFTAFNAYEWTATPGGNTMHRIVLFANDQVPSTPLDYLHYPSVVSLMNGLNAQCINAGTGCDVITMPHNPNLSGGQAWNMIGGATEASLRAQFDRLAEVHQHKGNSECPPTANGGTDPDCNFEQLNSDLSGSQVYVRDGLKLGLSNWSSSRVDPFQFGLQASTDNHYAVPGKVEEYSWDGFLAELDDSADKRLSSFADHNPGGLTGVWATQNTRDALFTSLKNREVFATSGPRMQVRFYQTWNSSVDYCQDANFPQEIVDAGGIPMGGTMAPQAGNPNFVIWAKEEDMPIVRIQVIKAWLGSDGMVHEQVNPVWSGSSAMPCVTWTDTSPPGATYPAFYYARVFQQSTARWSDFDCANDPNCPGVNCPSYCSDPSRVYMIEERAYSSPIFQLP